MLAEHRRDHIPVSTQSLAASRAHIIAHSAHDFPPVFASFAGIGSMPFNLYRIIYFDKLHVMDLGVIRLFCDMCHILLQKASRSSLTRTMATANSRYRSLPPAARLSSHYPFKTTTSDSQAGMSGKIRRQSVPFLWVCIMGLAACTPDDDKILQLALHLDVVNNFLCDVRYRTADEIRVWQDYLFSFGVLFTSVTAVDVSTKLHRVMRHVDSHLLQHVCLRRGSSEDNEMAHKEFKSLYTATNQHLDEIGPQLLQAWTDPSIQLVNSQLTDDVDGSSSEHDDDATVNEAGVEILNSWTASCSQASAFVAQHTPSYAPHIVQARFVNKFNTPCPTWRPVKSARLPHTEHLISNAVYGGEVVYGKRNRRDGIVFMLHGTRRYGLVHCVFAPVQCRMPRSARLIFALLLDQIDPDQGNTTVVQKFGHERFKFNRSSSGHITVVAIQASNLLGPAMFVLDPYWLRQEHGVHTEFQKILDSNDLLPSAKFFKLNNFNFERRTQVSGS